MDTCFGLVREECQGQICGEPKHGTFMFSDQDDVDNFVDHYTIYNTCMYMYTVDETQLYSTYNICALSVHVYYCTHAAVVALLYTMSICILKR